MQISIRGRAHKIPEDKMPREIVQTGNKTCMKHLFLSQNFAWLPNLIFCMNVSLFK